MGAIWETVELLGRLLGEEESMDIEERLKAEQHGKLKELQEKLGGVLDHEPADSEDENEGAIWRQANDLKSALDCFFESKCGETC